jgi:transposase
MVQNVIRDRFSASRVAEHYGVSAATVREWAGSFLAEGDSGLADARQVQRGVHVRSRNRRHQQS